MANNYATTFTMDDGTVVTLMDGDAARIADILELRNYVQQLAEAVDTLSNNLSNMAFDYDEGDADPRPDKIGTIDWENDYPDSENS